MQLAYFSKIRHWTIVPTRFAQRHHLDIMHLDEAVSQLFGHIGWSGILEWHEMTYERPTLEFLSTAYLSPDKTILHFRTNCTDCSVLMRDINDLGSDSNNASTFAPENLPEVGLVETQFWRVISDDPDPYESRTAKASLIRHPALRVAHRLIALMIFGREDHGTVNSLELFLLYAMTHGNPMNASRQKPDFARWLLFKPLSIAAGRRTRIVCGGIITHILKSHLIPADLRLMDEDLDPVAGATILTAATCRKIGMYTTDTDPEGHNTHCVWLRCLDNTRYLRLPIDKDEEGSDLLQLTPDIRDQNWNLPANAFGPGPPPANRPRRQHIPEPVEPAQFQAPPPDFAQFQAPPPDYPPYHNLYMSNFDHLRGRVDSIEASLQAEREEALLRWQQQQSFQQEAQLRWQHQQAYEEEMLRLQQQMYGMHFPPPPPPT